MTDIVQLGFSANTAPLLAARSREGLARSGRRVHGPGEPGPPS